MPCGARASHTYPRTMPKTCCRTRSSNLPCMTRHFQTQSTKRPGLLRVAINECKDILKAARAKNISLESRLEAYNDHLLGIQDNSTQTEIGVKRILEAMDALGDPPKTQVYLSLVEGYTAPEISEMTNMPENTVYSWISRGRKRLREVLS